MVCWLVCESQANEEHLNKTQFTTGYKSWIKLETVYAVVDLGFPRRNPKSGGINLLFWPFIPENYMKVKKIRPGAIGMRNPMDPLSDLKAGEVRGFGSSLWLISLQDGVVGGEMLQFPLKPCTLVHSLLAVIKLFLIWTW